MFVLFCVFDAFAVLVLSLYVVLLCYSGVSTARALVLSAVSECAMYKESFETRVQSFISSRDSTKGDGGEEEFVCFCPGISGPLCVFYNRFDVLS